MRKSVSQTTRKSINIEYQSCLAILAALIFVTLILVSNKSVNCSCVTCHNNIFNAADNNGNNNTTTPHQANEESVIVTIPHSDDNGDNAKHNPNSNNSNNNINNSNNNNQQQQRQQQQQQDHDSVDKLTDLSQLELNNIRTEFFKYKILDKLGLSDEPRVGARSSEVERDFLTNFQKQNQDLDRSRVDAEDSTSSHEADKLILRGRQIGPNRLEFDLAQSHLISMLNNKLSSILLSIRLKKAHYQATATAATTNTATTSANSNSKNNITSHQPSYIRLILEEHITRANSSDITSKEILITNDRVILLSSLFNHNNNHLTKPINVAAVDYATTTTTTTTPRDSDYTNVDQQQLKSQILLHEIELLPSIAATLLRNDNNQQNLTIGDRIYEELTLRSKEEHRRYKLVLLFPTNSIQITSAYLSLVNKVPETMFARSKRSIDCANIKNNKSSCCRESFYVNFTDIGWDKWILHPPGYYANYCKGRCDLSHARFYHSSILSRFSNLISLCCSPKQMSHLTLIYLDQDHQLHQKVMPDMTVESCDCS